MGRRAVLQGLEKKAELLPRVLFGDVEQAEHPGLDFRPVDTDAAAADLGAVENDIIGLGLDLQGIGLQEPEVLVPGRGEGMVHGVVALLVGVPLDQRKVRDPEEVEFSLVDEVQPLAQEQTEMAQGLGNDLGTVRHEEHEVAGLCPEPRGDGLELAFFEELGYGRLEPAVGDLDPGQSLCPEDLRLIREVVQLLPRHPREPGRGESLHRSAQLNSLEKNLEVRCPGDVGDVLEFQPEAGVGLVRTVAVHGLLVRQPREGNGQVGPFHLFHDRCHELLHEGHNIFGVDEGHLEVDLRKLRLPVGAEVLVAEALHDLVVPFEPRHHEDLLEELGRLRKGKEHPRVQSARDQIIPGPLGGALGQERRLHVDEPVAVEKAAHGLGDLMAGDKRLLELRPAEVEVPVLEPQGLGHVRAVLDHEGRGLGRVQNNELRGRNLDLAGGKLCIGRVRRPGSDLSRHGKDEFAPDVTGRPVRVSGNRGVEHHLRDAGAVAEVDENEPAVVPSRMRPPHDGHGGPDVLYRQFPAGMRFFRFQWSIPLLLKTFRHSDHSPHGGKHFKIKKS